MIFGKYCFLPIVVLLSSSSVSVVVAVVSVLLTVVSVLKILGRTPFLTVLPAPKRGSLKLSSVK